MVLRPGDLAPDFTLEDQHGRRRHLAELLPGAPVLIVFYPFAFTPICTSELGELAVRARELAGTQVVAISCDAVPTLRAFSDDAGLGDLTLLSDFWPHGKVSSAYGALLEGPGHPTRATYLVAADGRVAWSHVTGPGTRRDFTEYVNAVVRNKTLS